MRCSPSRSSRADHSLFIDWLDRVREAVRTRHYSRRTEEAYVGWIGRFIGFHGKRHPRDLGESEVSVFVSSLAARGVSASTQNQALSAVLFLYQVVVGRRPPWMDGIVRAQRPARLPVVLSRGEVAALLGRLRGPVWLMASLMFGGGLRLLECAELRVKDFSFDRGELTIRDGKGGKDRLTLVPVALQRPLLDHLARVKAQHEADLSAGRGTEEQLRPLTQGTGLEFVDSLRCPAVSSRALDVRRKILARQLPSHAADGASAM